MALTQFMQRAIGMKLPAVRFRWPIMSTWNRPTTIKKQPLRSYLPTKAVAKKKTRISVSLNRQERKELVRNRHKCKKPSVLDFELAAQIRDMMLEAEN